MAAYLDNLEVRALVVNNGSGEWGWDTWAGT